MKKVPTGPKNTQETDQEYGGQGYKEVGMTEQSRGRQRACVLGPTRDVHTLSYPNLSSDTDY